MPKPTSLVLYRSRRRWTDAEAREALEALDASGLSTAEFALQEGLDAQRLYWWRRKLAKVEDGAPAPAIVELTTSSGISAHVEVVLSSGRILRFPPAIDSADLRRIVAVLEHDAC